MGQCGPLEAIAVGTEANKEYKCGQGWEGGGGGGGGLGSAI